MCLTSVYRRRNKSADKMKAMVDLPASGSVSEGVQSGRVGRRRDIENEEIQMYLSKLKDLVPFMPKNRRLSKLEVIRHVIEYICELQCALESHPAGLGASEVAARLQGESVSSVTAPTSGAHQRQPLGTLAPSPNTIVSRHSGSTSPVPGDNALHQLLSPANSEKSQETDIRPVSC